MEEGSRRVGVVKVDDVLWPVGQELFRESYLKRDRPIKLRNFAVSWPAFRKWDFDWLADVVEGREAEVSHSVEEHEETKKSNYGMSSVLRALGKGETLKDVYVKQWGILWEVPELGNDLLPIAGKEDGGSGWVPPFEDRLAIVTPWVWVGPPGSVTGTHTDDERNVLVQLRGRKRVMLCSPEFSQFLSVNDKYDCGTVCASEDIRPEHCRVLDRVQVLECILEPGDAVVIPKFWWHHVSSIGHEPTLSINYFVSNAFESLVTGLPRTIGYIGHNLGIYRRNSCVCHNPQDPPPSTETILVLTAVMAVLATTILLYPKKTSKK